jgi:hypothetical protein
VRYHLVSRATPLKRRSVSRPNVLTRTQYLKLCLLLPFVGAPLWAAVALSAAILPIPDWLGGAATVGWMAIFLFGVPYAVLAGTTALVLRGRSFRAHVVLALLGPCLMLLTIVGISFVSGDRDIHRTIIVFGPSCLGAGYFYVALAFAGWFVLSRRGYLAP